MFCLRNYTSRCRDEDQAGIQQSQQAVWRMVAIAWTVVASLACPVARVLSPRLHPRLASRRAGPRLRARSGSASTARDGRPGYIGPVSRPIHPAAGRRRSGRPVWRKSRFRDPPPASRLAVRAGAIGAAPPAPDRKPSLREGSGDLAVHERVVRPRVEGRCIHSRLADRPAMSVSRCELPEGRPVRPC